MKNIFLYIIIIILVSIIIYQNNNKKETKKKFDNITLSKTDTKLEIKANKIQIKDDDAVFLAKKDLTLLRKDDNNVSIEWSIDTKNIILDNGDLSNNVKLIATLSKNEAVDTKVFKFKIDNSLVKDDTMVESKTFKYLTSDFIKVDNESLEQTKSNLNLPEIGMDGSKIIWDSSHPNIISNKGIVMRPSFDQHDTEVTLTATIEKNGKQEIKEFLLTVLPDESEIRETNNY